VGGERQGRHRAGQPEHRSAEVVRGAQMSAGKVLAVKVIVLAYGVIGGAAVTGLLIGVAMGWIN